MKEQLLDVVFPPGLYCISCGALIDSSRQYSLCDKCIRKLHWINERTCEKCGKALADTYKGAVCYDCMKYSHSFERGYSCLTYGMLERELIFDLKYNGKSYLARIFGDMLYDRLTYEDISPDVIMPIPIHGSRERKRGYNQSELMARRLADKMGIPIESHILYRAKKTMKLRGLDPAEREAVLEGAFAVRKSASAIRCVAGKKILLVDDIYTTGATADACGRTLLQSGAGEVYLITLASGGNFSAMQDGEVV